MNRRTRNRCGRCCVWVVVVMVVAMCERMLVCVTRNCHVLLLGYCSTISSSKWNLIWILCYYYCYLLLLLKCEPSQAHSTARNFVFREVSAFRRINGETSAFASERVWISFQNAQNMILWIAIAIKSFRWRWIFLNKINKMCCQLLRIHWQNTLSTQYVISDIKCFRVDGEQSENVGKCMCVPVQCTLYSEHMNNSWFTNIIILIFILFNSVYVVECKCSYATHTHPHS